MTRDYSIGTVWPRSTKRLKFSLRTFTSNETRRCAIGPAKQNVEQVITTCTWNIRESFVKTLFKNILRKKYGETKEIFSFIEETFT